MGKTSSSSKKAGCRRGVGGKVGGPGEKVLSSKNREALCERGVGRGERENAREGALGGGILQGAAARRGVGVVVGNAANHGSRKQ